MARREAIIPLKAFELADNGLKMEQLREAREQRVFDGGAWRDGSVLRVNSFLESCLHIFCSGM